MVNTVDITPSPRILRTLGEIPFQPWQCLAELIDNSIDAFSEAARAGVHLEEKKITITWSSESVVSKDRAIEIIDTGPGMELSQLQNAARAGYSSNDPINNLGLFGMGFNISTARLGENTKLLSATKDSLEWTGIEIDFSDLIKNKSYSARVITEPKIKKSDHGTKVIISRLKGETYIRLRDQEAQIKKQLENIYSTLLSDIDVSIILQGKKMSARKHCVWSSSRYVVRDNLKIPAVINIDRDLGQSLFDKYRNAYLSWDEQEILREKYPNEDYPINFIQRHKWLRGWVGIQRYSDPNDFGIDFIRNGRKILISNKDLFSWENPLTGTSTLQYPVELGTTVGGRIVGEIHVDFLLPTYQKNDFDRTDPSWRETMEAIRGVGPILPQARKAMGYNEPNRSPVGLLANGYRRVDPGTKCLHVDKSTSRALLDGFRRGDSDYISDDKWWKAAQEADRQLATKGADFSTEVDGGSVSSDDVLLYGPESTKGCGTTFEVAETAVKLSSGNSLPSTSGILSLTKADSTLDTLIENSNLITSWTGAYFYSSTPSMNVKVWELSKDQISRSGSNVPFMFFQDGVDHDFVYDPRHPFLSQYPVEPRQLLCVYLSVRFSARDKGADVGNVYKLLIENHLQDLRVDRVSLQEKAASIFSRLRERLMIRLESRSREVLCCIHESSGEVEETVRSLLSNASLAIDFQNKEPSGFNALAYVPYRTLLRLIENFPEELFDGSVFAAPYTSLSLTDPQATERARVESKERVISFLKDALWVLGQTGYVSVSQGKDELSRCGHSISFLSREIID